MAHAGLTQTQSTSHDRSWPPDVAVSDDIYPIWRHLSNLTASVHVQSDGSNFSASPRFVFLDWPCPLLFQSVSASSVNFVNSSMLHKLVIPSANILVTTSTNLSRNLTTAWFHTQGESAPSLVFVLMINPNGMLLFQFEFISFAQLLKILPKSGAFSRLDCPPLRRGAFSYNIPWARSVLFKFDILSPLQYRYFLMLYILYFRSPLLSASNL